MKKRLDFDGINDRDAIFTHLHSFDASGLTESEFVRNTLSLIDLPSPLTPEQVLAQHVVGFQKRNDSVNSLVPADDGSTVDAANAILKNTFSFYGEEHALGDDINWEYNPGTGHWAHDLNRFSYLNTLLRAYLITRDRKYGEKLVGLVLDWVKKTDVCDAFIRLNPESHRPDKSRNVWSSYLNIAIHIEVWSFTLSRLMAACPDIISPVNWLRILKSLHDQLWYLDLVIPETTGNWVTIGTRGQLSCMGRISLFRDTPILATTAYQRLAEAVENQLLPDGAQFELTPHYHMVVVRNLDTALATDEFLPVDAPAQLWELYCRAVRYLPHVLTPDDKLVAFNDSDPSSGPGIREFLKTPRARKALGNNVDAELKSRFFPNSGVMIMRQGSSLGRDELYLAFDGGPFGCAHQHEDALGFWLSAYGRSFIVDPGRHLYDNSSASYRPYLVQTQAHSTITVDNASQCARQAGREAWLDPDPQGAHFDTTTDGFVTAEATYSYGYLDVPEKVIHTRRFTFTPQPGYWQLEDKLTGEGKHLITSRFQFMNGDLQIRNGVAHTLFSDANLAIFFNPDEWDNITVHTGEENPRQGWYSDGYNKIAHAPVLVLERRTVLPFTPTLTLFPYKGTTVPTLPGK